MIDPPKRTGYRLTYDAECLYNDWQEIGGCTCFRCAPCSSCCAGGHPISLEENDEAWELDYTRSDVYNAWKLKQEMEMSRQEITNKSDPPKSEWFGFKYRVNTESSKLLQEAVFKDGGGWGSVKNKSLAHTDEPFLIVREGEITYCDDEPYFKTCVFLPEKQPPQPAKVEPTKKEFVVGKYYKCVDNLGKEEVLAKGKYYYLHDMRYGNFWTTSLDGTREGARFFMLERFDINSESDYDPNTAQPAGYTAYVVFKQDFTEGVIKKGEYGGKEYAYKCSRDDYLQVMEYAHPFNIIKDGTVFAEVPAYDKIKTVKVLRVEAKVDPKATKSIVRILPKVRTDAEKELAKDVGTGRIQTVVKVSINRDDLLQHKHTGNNATTNVGDVNMSTTQRKVVEVQLFDDAKGLPVQDSLVAKFDNVLTEDDNDTTIREVIMNNDLKATLKAHNAKRAKVTNLDILERTGNSVPLQPILLKDLRWKVIG